MKDEELFHRALYKNRVYGVRLGKAKSSYSFETQNSFYSTINTDRDTGAEIRAIGRFLRDLEQDQHP